MKIAVFGIGYVGAVCAACLAADGHTVTSVDINPDKIGLLNAGRVTIREPGLSKLVETNVSAGRLCATIDTRLAAKDADFLFICVGTPSLANGDLDRSYVLRVCEEIGESLASAASFPVVVVRSTLLPGSTRHLVIPALESCSKRQAGRHFGVAFYPEFMREGTAISDFKDPEVVVLGIEDERTASAVRKLTRRLSGKHFVTDFETAEAVKYANNSWHATKVVFANEIGSLCKAIGIDSHKVMEIVCADEKLNLSRMYLRPGFAYGGSCLPKDLRALTYLARLRDVNLPMLEALEVSNTRQISRAFDLVQQAGNARVGLMGLSFKGGTDDLRESPAVELAKLLYGNGYQLRLYDVDVALSRLTGSNLSYIQTNLPHLAALLTDDLREFFEFSETIVVAGAGHVPGQAAYFRPGQVLIDLVRLDEALRPNAVSYQGFLW